MALIFRAFRVLAPNAWKYDTLEITISGEIPEELPHTGWVKRFTRARTAFRDYLFIMREARDDPNLKHVVFYIRNPALGWGRVWELREAIRELREAGLATIAFLDSAGNQGYYLAAACDDVFLAPSGQISLRGLATEALFFKGLLEKVNVKAELMHVGKYKSASELFTRKTMSQAHKEEINDLLDKLFAVFVKDIANDRRLTVSKVKKLIDHGSFLGGEAKAEGLADRLCYEDEVGDELEERLDRRPRRVSMGRYLPARMLGLPLDFHFKQHKRIALVYATGPIAMGQSSDYSPSGPSVGAETITGALKEIRGNKSIAGAVVRVASPGGSALASDLIWREMTLYGKDGAGRSEPQSHERDDNNPADDDGRGAKPFVVSMGDVAASGGYYISCAAEQVFASPMTITGSIGVVAGKFNIRGIFNMLGLGVETITRGKSADRDSAVRGFTPQEKKRVKHEMEAIYDDFVRKVGMGRNMKEQKVRELAQGRVWLGAQAAENGLVDKLGGLLPAIDEVKRQLDIPADERVIIEMYPRKKRFIRLPRPGGSAAWAGRLAAKYLIPLLPVDIQALLPLLRSDEPLAIMPYNLKIY